MTLLAVFLLAGALGLWGWFGSRFSAASSVLCLMFVFVTILALMGK